MTACYHRWAQVAYADLADVSSSTEAAARIATSLGMVSYPVATDHILKLHCWLRARPAAAGCTGGTCVFGHRQLRFLQLMLHMCCMFWRFFAA